MATIDIINIVKDIVSPEQTLYPDAKKFRNSTSDKIGFDYLTLSQLKDLSEYEFFLVCKFLLAAMGKSDLSRQMINTKEVPECLADQLDKNVLFVYVELFYKTFKGLTGPLLMRKDNALVLQLGDFHFPVEIQTDGKHYAKLLVGNLEGELYFNLKQNLQGEQYVHLYFLFKEFLLNSKGKQTVLNSWLVNIGFEKQEGNKYVDWTEEDIKELLYDEGGVNFCRILREVFDKTKFDEALPNKTLAVGIHQIKDYIRIEKRDKNKTTAWIIDYGYGGIKVWASNKLAKILTALDRDNKFSSQGQQKTLVGSYYVIDSKEVKGGKCYIDDVVLPVLPDTVDKLPFVEAQEAFDPQFLTEPQLNKLLSLPSANEPPLLEAQAVEIYNDDDLQQPSLSSSEEEDFYVEIYNNDDLQQPSLPLSEEEDF